MNVNVCDSESATCTCQLCAPALELDRADALLVERLRSRERIYLGVTASGGRQNPPNAWGNGVTSGAFVS